MKALYAILRGWLRRCPDCGRWENWAMTDGSWICHGCGWVGDDRDA